MSAVSNPMKWCHDHDVRWWDESCPASLEECNESCEIVVLMTREEFIASLDMTLLIDELQDLKSEYFDNAPCCAIDRTDALVEDARRLIEAALGEDTT